MLKAVINHTEISLFIFGGELIFSDRNSEYHLDYSGSGNKHEWKQQLSSVTITVALNDTLKSVDDYTKDGGPGKVWHLCSSYQDPLRP